MLFNMRHATTLEYRQNERMSREKKRVEDVWVARTVVNIRWTFFSSGSRYFWLYNIPDTHAINMATLLSSLFTCANSRGHSSFSLSAHGHASFKKHQRPFYFWNKVHFLSFCLTSAVTARGVKKGLQVNIHHFRLEHRHLRFCIPFGPVCCIHLLCNSIFLIFVTTYSILAIILYITIFFYFDNRYGIMFVLLWK